MIVSSVSLDAQMLCALDRFAAHSLHEPPDISYMMVDTFGN